MGTELSSALCDDLGGESELGGREAQEPGDICMAGSLPCTAETNITL